MSVMKFPSWLTKNKTTEQQYPSATCARDVNIFEGLKKGKLILHDER